jgi:hypothetical protein
VTNNAAMNRMFVAAARRGERVGPFGRTGEPTPSSPVLRERLSAALNDLEAAQRAGDDVMVEVHDSRVDQVVSEARAARAQREQLRDEGGRFAGFDGGVRGSHTRPTPGLSQPTSTELLAASFAAHRAERAERDDHPGQTIIARNI